MLSPEAYLCQMIVGCPCLGIRPSGEGGLPLLFATAEILICTRRVVGIGWVGRGV
jgi:hypothetical protein